MALLSFFAVGDYRRAAITMHPDKFSQAAQDEQKLAEEAFRKVGGQLMTVHNLLCTTPVRVETVHRMLFVLPQHPICHLLCVALSFTCPPSPPRPCRCSRRMRC
jgi:hypothetical protein